jgi:hypothetical protein
MGKPWKFWVWINLRDDARVWWNELNSEEIFQIKNMKNYF